MKKKTSLGVLLAFAFATVQAADPPATPVSPELAALQELYARIQLQRQILDEQRAMLKTNIGEGVTLPTGNISRADNPILASAIYYVSYEALKTMAQQMCSDLASAVPAPVIDGVRPPLTVLVSGKDLRDLREQRFAIVGMLKAIHEKVKRLTIAIGKLPAPTPPGQGRPAAEPLPREIGGILYGLDAIGAVGKAIAGLAAFFKTERQIGMQAAVVDEEVVMLALRTCDRTKIQFVDVLAGEMNEADFSDKSRYLKEVNDLRDAADELRVKIDGRPADTSVLIKQGIAALAVADSAIEKLSTVDEKTGVNPMVTLARMGRVNVLLETTYKAAPVVSIKVRHASGYSQINRTWWRSDKLDFAAGLAISFSVANLGGEVLYANMHYVQTPWYRLQEAHGKFSGEAHTLRSNP